MPGSLQTFLAAATTKAAADLEAALMRLPDDKRAWSPMGDARTALNMVAECAILNGSSVEMITTGVFPSDFDFAAFAEHKVRLSEDWPALQTMLHENAQKMVDVIGTVEDDQLSRVFQLPWAEVTMQTVLAYPYWNMSYHEGQINYIASMLGCLT